MRSDDWIQSAAAKLERAGVPEPKLDAQLLAGHVLGHDRSWILAHPEALIEGAEEVLARRENREPLAYIVGWREFYGRRFLVEPGVLVPRQETETIIDAALGGLGGKVLDIGTGTGCLAVTIKLERPTWMVAACDISQTAVKLARRNAEALEATVHVTKCDLFEGFSGTRFGLIVSNPPYIRDGEELQPEVGKFEPAEALFAGLDGLDVYRRLAQEAESHLMPWGRVIVEIGDGMESDVAAVFESQGWHLAESREDLGGRVRALTFKLEGSS